MGNACGCNKETLVLDSKSEVDLSVKEKLGPSEQHSEHRIMESTRADDEQS